MFCSFLRLTSRPNHGRQRRPASGILDGVTADPRLVVRPLRWDGRTSHPDDLAAFQRIYPAFEISRTGSVDTSAVDNV